nr:MAG TPA: hypothetical protein [Caudoviricetes sp.]
MAIVKTVTHGACKGYIHDDCIKSKEEQEKIRERLGEIAYEICMSRIRRGLSCDVLAWKPREQQGGN